jgi:AAHS family 4-hydroxybenzoate transporter-like MFS transporter
MSQQAAQADTIEVERVLGETRHPAFHFMLLAVTGLCLVIDGFDAQAMGYVAPSVIGEWHVSKAALGPVFSASLFGMLLGALGLSVLADRIGRRPVLIGTTLAFAVAMLATPFATSISGLIALRFVTGLGLGCIMPNAMALVGEFSPPAHRVKRMMLVSCGFTVGAALGGFVSAALIPAFGWRAVFYVGGAVPLALGLFMIGKLPESLQFLVVKGKAERARAWLSRFDPSLPLGPATRIVLAERNDDGAPVAELFRAGRTPVTLLLWAISFMNLIDLYFLSNWLPTLIRDAGYPTDTSVLVATALQVGGVIGTLTLGRLIDRLGFVRVLAVCFLVACATVALIGHVAAALPMLVAVVFIAGFCIVGGQPAVNALAATYYPTTLRATGIGWSLGVGRIGSVIGPVIGGQLIAMQWSGPALFQAAAVPALVSFGMVLALTLAASGADAARFASGRTTGKPA